MNKKLKRTLKTTLPSLMCVPLLASGTALFLDFQSTEAGKDKAIISLSLRGSNSLDVTYNYANLIRYLDGEGIPSGAGNRFANMNHKGSSGSTEQIQYQNWLQNAYELLVNPNDAKSTDLIAPLLDDQAAGIAADKNTGFLTNLKSANLQGAASFDINAVPIDAHNPPPGGETLASFSLDPSSFFKDTKQKFFQQQGFGVNIKPGSSVEELASVLDNQFKPVTHNFTIVGGHKFALEFRLNAVSSRSLDAPVTTKEKGFIDATVGAAFFQPYFGDDVWSPDFNTGDVFRFPVYIDPDLERENTVNNTNVVKFDIGANFATSPISIINIIWIAGAIVITLGLFSPLIVYGIRKW